MVGHVKAGGLSLNKMIQATLRLALHEESAKITCYDFRRNGVSFYVLIREINVDGSF